MLELCNSDILVPWSCLYFLYDRTISCLFFPLFIFSLSRVLLLLCSMMGVVVRYDMASTVLCGGIRIAIWQLGRHLMIQMPMVFFFLATILYIFLLLFFLFPLVDNRRRKEGDCNFPFFPPFLPKFGSRIVASFLFPIRSLKAFCRVWRNPSWVFFIRLFSFLLLYAN